MSKGRTILKTQNLAVGYGQKQVLSGLDLELKKGKLTCLLGPNGSGKSTLLRTLSKIQKPLGGGIELLGTPLSSHDNKSLAKGLSMVLTDRVSPGNLTAYALVSLGRFPYTSWMGSLSKEDEMQIQWAMEATDCIQHANTHIGELSDGERQKVMIARALAQDTPIVFLDEPTAHLDLPNRIEIFHLLNGLVHDSGKAILLSSHDLDMALNNADWLWLVTQDQTIKSGVPEDLVLQGELEKAFANEQVSFDYSDGNFKREGKRLKEAVNVSGPEVLVKWTSRALVRKGFQIVDSSSEISIRVEGDLQSAEWQLEKTKTTYKTIQQLLKAIEDE